MEALMVAGMAGALLLTHLPSWARPGGDAKSAACQGNFRRLVQAWQMYTDDYGGEFPLAMLGGVSQSGGKGWVSGWLDWNISPGNTNTAYLVDDRHSQLGAYLQRDASVFKCPSDTYVSPVQINRGWSRRVRSAVANPYVGAGNVASGPSEPIYEQIEHAGDLHVPGPSATWVHSEEHPDSINDPALYPPRRTSFIDLPASFHDGAATFTFADGHVELHAWESEATLIPVRFSFSAPNVPAGNPDIHWVSYRTPRKTDQSY